MVRRKKSRGLGYRTSDNLKRLTAKTISADIKAMEREIENCRVLLERAALASEVDQQRRNSLDTAAGHIRKQIFDIKNTEQNYVWRLLGFGKKELSRDASQRIEALQRDIEAKEQEIKLQLPYPCEIKDLYSGSYYKAKIGFYEQAIKRYQEYLAPKQKKEDKVAKWRAIAARENGTSREIATAVKKQLAMYKFCPYCGESLGAQPHADHIYPVSKGGLSVDSNMVYICQRCNLKKKDMTLNSFIKLYKLDRERIEQALSDLKKDF